MNVCFYIPNAEVFAPIHAILREISGSAAVDLTFDDPSTWPESMARADRIVVDVTGNEPAAFFCLGLAERFREKTTLLGAVAPLLPDFLGNLPLIVHGWNLEYLRSKLGDSIPVTADGGDEVDDSPIGQFRKRFGDLLRKHGYEHRGPVEFDGRVFTLREQEMELALVQQIANRAKSLNVRVRLL